MKKLTNVSPFLLLLVPVFMVMLFAFTINGNSADKEIVAKTTTSNTTTIVKAATAILK